MVPNGRLSIELSKVGFPFGAVLEKRSRCNWRSRSSRLKPFWSAGGTFACVQACRNSCTDSSGTAHTGGGRPRRRSPRPGRTASIVPGAKLAGGGSILEFQETRQPVGGCRHSHDASCIVVQDAPVAHHGPARGHGVQCSPGGDSVLLRHEFSRCARVDRAAGPRSPWAHSNSWPRFAARAQWLVRCTPSFRALRSCHAGRCPGRRARLPAAVT